MGQKFLIDTNIVIDTLGNIMPEKGRHFVGHLIPVVSVITYIEALGWYKASPKQLLPIQEFMNIARIIQIDQTIIEKTISIRQQKKIGLGDAVIAATALVENLKLVTRNISDFKNIEGLQIVDPYSL